MSLVEVLIAITVLAVVSVAFTKLVRSQIRFADRQVTSKDAREVSRSAINALATDIRMVDADSGIVAATRDSFTVVAPYAEGIVCGPAMSGGGTVIALLPYDSLTYVEGGYAGYAYIDTTTTGTNYRQVYQYVFNSNTPAVIDSATAANNAPCRTASDRVALFHYGAVQVQPAIPDRSKFQAAMLVRRVTYAFRPSVSVPGTRGLFRRVINGPRGDEELVAPFDTSARFMYYLNTGVKSASASGASLNLIRGIELQLNGVSDRVVPGSSTPQKAPMTTAIFFKNRPLQ